MKLVTPLAIILLIVTGRAAQAEVNCTAITAFDRLRDAEIRLSNHQTPSRFILDAAIIETEFEIVRNINLHTALGSNSLATNREVFENFITNTQDLQVFLHQGQKDRVRSFLETPKVKENIAELSLYLRSLPCSEQLQSVSLVTAGDKSTEGRRIIFQFDLLRIALLLAATVLGAGAIWLHLHIRHKQRRRTQRYSANYATTYRVGKGDFEGALLDISGWGSKLKHHPDSSLTIGERIEISIADDWKGGTIVWHNTHYSGLRFDKALRQKTVKQVHTALTTGRGLTA